MFCPNCSGNLTNIGGGVFVCKSKLVGISCHYIKWVNWDNCIEQIIIDPYLLRFVGSKIKIYDFNKLILSKDDINCSYPFNTKEIGSFVFEDFDLANEITSEFIENMLMLS